MRICHRLFLIIAVTIFGFSAFEVHAKFAYADTNSADFSPFEQNGKFGIKNTNGDILIPAEYDKLGWSDNSFSITNGVTGYRSNNKWGVINLQNQKVTKPIFDELFPGEGSVLIVRKQLSKGSSMIAGCIDTQGKEIIPMQYDDIKVASMRAIVSKRSGSLIKQGLIDFTNTVLIPINYSRVHPLGSLRFAVVSKENKTAIFSEDGKQLTEFFIDSISTFKKDFAVIHEGFYQGIINRLGEIVVKPQYRDVEITDDGKIKARLFDQWIYFEGGNKEKKRFFADSISSATAGVYKAKIGNTYFLADEKLKPLENLVFSHLPEFINGKAIFRYQDEYGIVRQDGSIILKPSYRKISRQENAFIAMDQKQKYFLLDSNGNLLSRKGYEQIESFNGSFFPVRNKSYWGAIDLSGKEIIACVHDSLHQSRNDLVVVKFKGLYGIINKNEDWIVTPQRHELKILSNERYLAFVDGTSFLKSTQGDVIYFTTNKVELKDGKYLLEYLQDGGVIRITMNGRIDRMDATPGIQNILPESEGYRAIRRDGKFGFIDSQGRLRIANRYDDVKRFSDGLAAIKLLGKWGFINKEDKIAVQPVYDEVYSFKGGYAKVKRHNYYGIIDRTGKAIVPVRYDRLEILESGRYLVEQNGELGLLNNEGQFIINVKYTHLRDLNNGFVIVARDNKWGVITTEGVSTIPMIYDGMDFDEQSNDFIALKKSNWEEAPLNISNFKSQISN